MQQSRVVGQRPVSEGHLWTLATKNHSDSKKKGNFLQPEISGEVGEVSDKSPLDSSLLGS